jgi:hypothetical protein
MKTAANCSAAFVLPVSAIPPALASDFEDQTNAERNTYLDTAGARVKQVSHVQGDETLGTDAFAQAPALTGGQINDPVRSPISAVN